MLDWIGSGLLSGSNHRCHGRRPESLILFVCSDLKNFSWHQSAICFFGVGDLRFIDRKCVNEKKFLKLHVSRIWKVLKKVFG